MNNTTATFKTGRSYFARSIGDYNCKFTYEIIRRTAKSVWIKGDNVEGTVRKSIKVWNNEETFMPLGSYSMAPIVGAEKVI